MATQDSDTEGRWNREVDAVRECFARRLAAWAGDMLELRRRGMQQFRWSSANPAECAAKPSPSQADGSIVPMNRAA